MRDPKERTQGLFSIISIENAKHDAGLSTGAFSRASVGAAKRAARAGSLAQESIPANSKDSPKHEL